MSKFKAAKSLRIRYIIGLTAIALLVTASFLTMQRIVSEQRNFAKLVNLAGHQSGLSNRIAYFAGLMATTDDETEFKMARSQVGLTISKMEKAHRILREGDPESGIPMITNENLHTIYEDPMIGLHLAVSRYLERARVVYGKSMDELSINSFAYVFLTTYGPHVLEPMFDSVVEELERIGEEAILRIEKLEMFIWLTTLVVLFFEIILIFYPLEKQIHSAVNSLEDSVNELTQTRKKLLDEHSFMQHIIDGVGDPVMVMDTNYRVMRMNRAAKESIEKEEIDLASVTRQELLPQTVQTAGEEQYETTLKSVIETVSPRKVVHKHSFENGQSKTYEILASPLLSDQGEVAGIVEVSRDVSEYLQLLDQLQESHHNYEHLAQHDTLTGLPNRLLFNDRLDHAIHAAHRRTGKLAVLFIDLDGFKNINDSFDHSFGDEVLKAVANRLKRIVREDDTFARMGGDEFTVILNTIHHAQDAALVAKKILDAFKQPFDVDEHTVFLGASIGISIYPKQGTTSDDLIRNADSAMYRAKEEGRNTFRYYSEGMTEKAFERIRLEASLRKALEQNELILYYQPQFNLANGEVIGFEALVRWQHPEMGLVSPAKFIPVAEESSLIIPIGEWILQEACQQMTTWLKTGFVRKDTLMCVNISAKQFDNKKLSEQIQKTLKETGLSAHNLELEITESTMMRSPGMTKRVLKQLRELGTKIAIDDFGTGYSSLSHLKILPLTKLKIDQSFVSDIPKDSNDIAITEAVIALGQSLSLEVLAEGIETEEQQDFLIQLGCDSGQGYLLGKPLAARDIENYIQDIRASA